MSVLKIQFTSDSFVNLFKKYIQVHDFIEKCVSLEEYPRMLLRVVIHPLFSWHSAARPEEGRKKSEEKNQKENEKETEQEQMQIQNGSLSEDQLRFLGAGSSLFNSVVFALLDAGIAMRCTTPMTVAIGISRRKNSTQNLDQNPRKESPNCDHLSQTTLLVDPTYQELSEKNAVETGFLASFDQNSSLVMLHQIGGGFVDLGILGGEGGSGEGSRESQSDESVCSLGQQAALVLTKFARLSFAQHFEKYQMV